MNFRAIVRADNFKEYPFSIHAENIEDAKRIVQDKLKLKYPELSVLSIRFEYHIDIKAPFKVGDKVKCVATKEQLDNLCIRDFNYKPNDVFTIARVFQLVSGESHYGVKIEGSSYIFDDFMFRKVEEPKVKEMTVKEIEEKLGYSIKVVKEKI